MAGPFDGGEYGCADADAASATIAMSVRTAVFIGLLPEPEAEQRRARLNQTGSEFVVACGVARARRAEELRRLPDVRLDRGGLDDALAVEQRGETGDVRRGHRRAGVADFGVAVEAREQHQRRGAQRRTDRRLKDEAAAARVGIERIAARRRDLDVAAGTRIRGAVAGAVR